MGKEDGGMMENERMRMRRSRRRRRMRMMRRDATKCSLMRVDRE